jgi:hypothetical protein
MLTNEVFYHMLIKAKSMVAYPSLDFSVREFTKQPTNTMGQSPSSEANRSSAIQ